tara:strand:- start:12525 stop:12728 length:204 start_codon:yes stop_codon:yes gene_type:complete
MNKNLEEAFKVLTELGSEFHNLSNDEILKNVLLAKDLIEGQLVVNNLRSEYVISPIEMGMVNNKKSK